ncbi:uncharacterized protein PAC_00864 [Phialocephala subalpina]|uniref:Uncharacterized protein n=1 Tax=Phialocephala subalpina TaxID=576137 RepID=A0A1L7WE45_9HELO|nr:uncharacterized protein PAC_00864 [Phialocephala subalpina]
MSEIGGGAVFGGVVSQRNDVPLRAFTPPQRRQAGSISISPMPWGYEARLESPVTKQTNVFNTGIRNGVRRRAQGLMALLFLLRGMFRDA